MLRLLFFTERCQVEVIFLDAASRPDVSGEFCPSAYYQ